MKQYISSIFLPLLYFSIFACVRVVEDPAKKYNKEFLSKYGMVIREPKTRHKIIANDFGIKYTENVVKNTVDAIYYDNMSVKNKKNFVAKSNRYNKTDIINKDMEYLEQDKSIYKPESNLRENKLDSLKETGNVIAYLDENYSNYKQEQNNIEIEISKDTLYGSLLERKNKKYYIIDNDELLVSYDYIDLLSRVRTDIYIQQQQEQTQQQQQSNENSLKQKILNVFSKISKK